MWLAKELEHWREFYLLVGTAGAALLALLFVAVSLGAGYLTNDKQAPTRTFMSPVVIHYTSVFFISAVALIPAHRAEFFAVMFGATAVIGATVSSVITWRVFRSDMTSYMEDRFAYGVLPALAYLALLIAAIMTVTHQETALDILAGALLLLTIVNIRNAWDLMLTMVRWHRDNRA